MTTSTQITAREARVQSQKRAIKLKAKITLARRHSKADFDWFLHHVFAMSFDNFISGEYIHEVAAHIQDHTYTINVTGRNHFKSTRLYADIMWAIFTNEEAGFEAWYFSYAHELAAYHVKKIKGLIKDNPYFTPLRDHKPTSESVIDYSWDGENHMTVTPSGLLCVHPDQSVLTAIGKKAIKDVVKGDMVLTHDGSWQPVLDTISRTWGEHEGALLSIKGRNIYEPLKVSKNHQVLAVKAANCPIHKGCYPWHTRHQSHDPKKYKPIFANYEPQWVSAKELKEGDLLVIPKHHYNNDKYDPDILRLIGYYLAEGYLYHSIDKQGRHRGWYVRWVTSAKQPEMINDISNIMLQIWGRKVSVTIEGNTARLSVGCKPLYKLLEQFGKGAVNKVIPLSFTTLQPELINQLLKGYWLGDGYLYQGQHSFASVSLPLLETIQRILFNQNISSSISKTISAGTYTQNGKIYNRRDAYRLEISDSQFNAIVGEHRVEPKSNVKRIGFTDNYTLIPIQSINTIATDTVYDLSIGNNHNFATPFTISNSFKRGIHAERIYVDDPLRDPENKLNPTSVIKINHIMKTELLPMVKRGGVCRVVGTPQTAEDFFFDESMNKLFDVWITPAIIDEPNGVALWEEWLSFDELISLRRTLGERIFNPEYMATPVFSEDSYIRRDKLIPLCTEVCLPFTRHPELDNKMVTAGFDIGKKVHPSHLAVWVRETNGQFYEVFQKWMDGWEYQKQLKYLNDAIELFNITDLRYDNTRGEFEIFVEQGLARRDVMKPMVLNRKNETAMAANFGAVVDRGEAHFINEKRQISQILAVTNNLEAMTGPEGHGDAFWSNAMALYTKRQPTVRWL